jgi:aldehyde dehydrogenase (NAD+)
MDSAALINKDKTDNLNNNNSQEVIHAVCYIAGEPINSENILEVKSPYDGRLVGTVKQAGLKHTQQAIEIALKGGIKLNKQDSY